MFPYPIGGKQNFGTNAIISRRHVFLLESEAQSNAEAKREKERVRKMGVR